MIAQDPYVPDMSSGLSGQGARLKLVPETRAATLQDLSEDMTSDVRRVSQAVQDQAWETVMSGKSPRVTAQITAPPAIVMEPEATQLTAPMTVADIAAALGLSTKTVQRNLQGLGISKYGERDKQNQATIDRVLAMRRAIDGGMSAKQYLASLEAVPEEQPTIQAIDADTQEQNRDAAIDAVGAVVEEIRGNRRAIEAIIDQVVTEESDLVESLLRGAKARMFARVAQKLADQPRTINVFAHQAKLLGGGTDD